MYGAIIGDIVGSRFEFDRGSKTKEFELFTSECDFTDDTVMTVAVAEALMDAGKDAGEREVKACLIKSMKKWGQQYPHAGYGARFIGWVLSDDPKPYGSYGNGSGMRVSAAGWLYDTIERTREVARWTAEVTHNHPEGVKGAESLAAAIFMARHYATKKEIKEYIVSEFGYDLSRTLDEIRPTYQHVEDCMHTMPEAFECFLEAEGFEDCIRNVMYIGGDADTLGAIAGALAQAYWGVPVKLQHKAWEYLDQDIIEVIKRFNMAVDAGHEDDPYYRNKYIKLTAAKFRKTEEVEDLYLVLGVIRQLMERNGEAPMPMVDVNGVMAGFDLEKALANETFTLDQDLRLRMDNVTDSEGNVWLPLFTDNDEADKHPATGIRMNVRIADIMSVALHDEKLMGVVINPFSEERVSLTKPALEILFADLKIKEEE